MVRDNQINKIAFLLHTFCILSFSNGFGSFHWGILFYFLSETYITTPEPIPNPCNSKQGFKPFGNGCYKFVTSPKNWTDASKYCSNQGAFLVTIASVFEQAFIHLLVDGTDTWTGLNDVKVTELTCFILWCMYNVYLEKNDYKLFLCIQGMTVIFVIGSQL